MTRRMLWSLIVTVTLLLGLLLFYFLCVNHVSLNEVGIAYNPIIGTEDAVTVQEHPGFYITSPLVQVIYFETLPIRVTIPSGAKVINTRLVRFNPKGAREFIKLQGFSYTLGSQLENILLGYAFSGRTYPFMDILEEPAPPL